MGVPMYGSDTSRQWKGMELVDSYVEEESARYHPKLESGGLSLRLSAYMASPRGSYVCPSDHSYCHYYSNQRLHHSHSNLAMSSLHG